MSTGNDNFGTGVPWTYGQQDMSTDNDNFGTGVPWTNDWMGFWTNDWMGFWTNDGSRNNRVKVDPSYSEYLPYIRELTEANRQDNEIVARIKQRFSRDDNAQEMTVGRVRDIRRYAKDKDEW